jgi:hypothetical protein
MNLWTSSNSRLVNWSVSEWLRFIRRHLPLALYAFLVLPLAQRGNRNQYEEARRYNANLLQQRREVARLPRWARSKCFDGTYSSSSGSGTCSWHGGVKEDLLFTYLAASAPLKPLKKYDNDTFYFWGALVFWFHLFVLHVQKVDLTERVVSAVKKRFAK